MNCNYEHSSARRSLRSTAFGVIATAAVLALGIADANAQRGGGRGGGGGGRMAQSSVSGASHSAPRPSTGNVNAGNRANTGNVNSGNRTNTGNVNTGNVNTGNRVNTGDVNIGNDVNIDIDGGYGYHGNVRYPVAAGVAIGAMAVTTAAVMGSYYYKLPTSCTVVVRNGISYHYCGSVYYQQTWSGNDVVYVVVSP